MSLAADVENKPRDDRRASKAAGRRAVIAATVGTTIEWYDFYIYGVVAALVFGKLYFPAFDPFAATLLSFSTFRFSAALSGMSLPPPKHTGHYL